jgi:hypothetical protein
MYRPVLAYTQHRLFPGQYTYNLRREVESVRESSSLYTVGGGLDWAGRPVYTGSAKKVQEPLSRMLISGPVFGAVGGSRFST